MAWWSSRPAVAVGGVLVGLIVGAGVAAPAEDTDLDAKVRTLTAERGELEDQVLSLKDSAVEQTDIDEQIDSAVSAAQDEADAATEAAVAAAVAKERQRAKRLVAQAKAQAKAAAKKPAAQPKPSGGGGGGTDPRFGTCGEANDNGYGPYTSGVDPEYDWYQDRDGDGVVCER